MKMKMNLKLKILGFFEKLFWIFLFGNKKAIFHISLGNLKKTRPKQFDVFDFSLFSYFNKESYEWKLYEKAIKQTGCEEDDNLSKRLRHIALFQILISVLEKNIKGNIAECGCFRGQSSYGIASILKKFKFEEKFFIFDSFEGLSDLSPEDRNEIRILSNNEVITQQKSFAADLEVVKNNLRDFSFVQYYKGWIPDRFPEVKNKKFSFVHIDVDLYRPIKDALDFFYPRLEKGGIIVLDDYGMSQFPGAKKAVDEFLKKENPDLFFWHPFGGAFIKK